MSVLQCLAEECLIFGQFKLSSGLISDHYIDIRAMLCYPNIMTKLQQQVCQNIEQNATYAKQYLICGVPLGGIPISTLVSQQLNKPLIMLRKEPKKYGKCQLIEGKYKKGDRVVLVEDVVSTGNSLLETIKTLEKEGLIIDHVIVILDRQMTKNPELSKYKVRYLYSMLEVLDKLLQKLDLSNRKQVFDMYKQFYKTTNFDYGYKPEILANKDYYEHKLQSQPNPDNINSQLLKIMLAKKSNLVLSMDDPDLSKILNTVEQLAPHIVILKVHSDTWGGQQLSLLKQLKTLALEYSFLIMDDRKLADIGATTLQQIKPLESYVDMMTIHSFAVTPQVLLETNMGLIVIDSMSHDQGKQFMDLNYHKLCHKIIQNYHKNDTYRPAMDTKFIGYISQYPFLENSRWYSDLYMTPGVKLTVDKTDDQNYNSLKNVVAGKTDLIIVGRDIWQSDNMIEKTKKYQEISWNLVEYV